MGRYRSFTLRIARKAGVSAEVSALRLVKKAPKMYGEEDRW